MDILEFAWEESMRTGDEITDLQHRELIRQLNLLLRAMHRRRAEPQVQAMLDFLSRYVVEHFSHEEACMERVRCPLAGANRRAHAEFMARFDTLAREWANNSSPAPLIAVKMLRDLSEWFIRHIRSIDARMLPYVIGSSNASSPSAIP